MGKKKLNCLRFKDEFLPERFEATRQSWPKIEGKRLGAADLSNWRINNRPVIKRREKPREIRNNRLSDTMAASTKKKNDATVRNTVSYNF